MPARSIDNATLAFGLVAIPVKIYATGEPSHELHLHLVHQGCGERLHQQYVCPTHGKVERDEIVKGYELTRGHFIELSNTELKALEAVASDEIAIHEFVPAAAVDPLFIEHSYYLGPGKSADRAFQLLRDALVEAELVAIATYAARGKQYVVEVRPYETGLAMHQLRYPDEIKAWREIPAARHLEAAPAELALARQLIEHLRHQTFDPTRYKDQVKARVRALIATKVEGGEITAPPTIERPPVTDLMAALKASLGAHEPTQRSAAEAGATTKRPARSPRPRGMSSGHARTARPHAGRPSRTPAPRAHR
jgi:DNA end-binding protein Ku